MSLSRQKEPFFARNDFIFGCTTAVVAFCVAVSCAPKGGGKKGGGGGSVVKDCTVSDAQANTLQGHWGNLPIKVSFKKDDWSGSEITAIQAGGNTWNNFFQSSKGLTVFDLGPSGSGNVSQVIQSSPTCTGGTLSDGTVIYKRFSNWTKSASAIAVTSTCFTGATSGLPTIFNAIMEFNYVNFFVDTSGKFPDHQSIAVHELGHLLGLDHSCGPLGKPNQTKPNVGCPDVNSAPPDDPIVSSVVFPVVFFDGSGAGEIKQNPNAADQGRANCLYGQ